MKPTNDLKNEHIAIKEMLVIMGAVCKKLEHEEKVDPEHLESITGFIKGFADKCHHGKEEEFLFPAIREAAGKAMDVPISIMLKDHELGREYVKKINNAIIGYKKGSKKDTAKLIENIKGYVSLLTNHIEKEDKFLFPKADEILSKKKQDELEKSFQMIEHERIGNGKHEEYHRLLHSLKEIYLQ